MWLAPSPGRHFRAAPWCRPAARTSRCGSFHRDRSGRWRTTLIGVAALRHIVICAGVVARFYVIEQSPEPHPPASSQAVSSLGRMVAMAIRTTVSTIRMMGSDSLHYFASRSKPARFSRCRECNRLSRMSPLRQEHHQQDRQQAADHRQRAPHDALPRRRHQASEVQLSAQEVHRPLSRE